jgi:hypothetical protein
MGSPSRAFLTPVDRKKIARKTSDQERAQEEIMKHGGPSSSSAPTG